MKLVFSILCFKLSDCIKQSNNKKRHPVIWSASLYIPYNIIRARREADQLICSFAYFATVLRLTRHLRAISAFGTPFARRRSTRICFG